MLATTLVATATSGASPSNSLSEDELLSWSHVGLGIGTLVPVTEASVWLSNCRPTTRTQAALVRYLALSQPAAAQADPKYSPLHVRAAILSATDTIFVSEGLGMKVVTGTTVRYAAILAGSNLASALEQAFKQCPR